MIFKVLKSQINFKEKINVANYNLQLKVMLTIHIKFLYNYIVNIRKGGKYFFKLIPWVNVLLFLISICIKIILIQNI